MAGSLELIGRVLADQGKYADSLPMFEEAFDIYTRVNNPLKSADVLGCKSISQSCSGNVRGSLQSMKQQQLALEKLGRTDLSEPIKAELELLTIMALELSELSLIDI